MGGFSVPGGTFATSFASTTLGKFGLGTFASGGFSALAEFGGEYGDKDQGYISNYDPSKILHAGIAGAAGYGLFGEAALTSYTEAREIAVPLVTQIVLQTQTALASTGADALLDAQGQNQKPHK